MIALARAPHKLALSRTSVVMRASAPLALCSTRLEGNVKKFESQSETVKGNISALQKGNQ